MDEIEKTNIYTIVANLLHKARRRVKTAVNTTMVHTYFEIGRIIVEEEQNGEERADYGKQLIKNLSIKLTNEFGKGFSKRNLDNMKKFYLAYSIVQNRSAQFKLSFSQYIILSRMKNTDERNLYEIEAANNNWNIEELERQIDSALYDRFVKLDEENKTIGIVVCKDKKDTIVEITLPENNNQIFASKYMTVLPSKDELKRIVEEQIK